jgi:hypothetical protein
MNINPSVSKLSREEQFVIFSHEFGHLLRHRDAYDATGDLPAFRNSFLGWRRNLMANPNGNLQPTWNWRNVDEIVAMNRGQLASVYAFLLVQHGGGSPLGAIPATIGLGRWYP